MTRLQRTARLEELARLLAQILRLIREIETSRVLARLQAEDLEPGSLVSEALRPAQAPGMPGTIANVRGTVASALETD